MGITKVQQLKGKVLLSALYMHVLWNTI